MMLDLFYLVCWVAGLATIFGVCAFVCDRLEKRRAHRRSHDWLF